jgi:hypothetical protein
MRGTSLLLQQQHLLASLLPYGTRATIYNLT